MTLAAASRFTVLRVPGGGDRSVDPDLRRSRCAGSFPRNMALRLLVSYVASLLDLEALGRARAHPARRHACLRSAAVALGAREGRRCRQGPRSRAARLNAIKADILAHLGQRESCRSRGGVRHGISPVYVRKLFEGEGSSFSEFVLRAARRASIAC